MNGINGIQITPAHPVNPVNPVCLLALRKRVSVLDGAGEETG